MTIADPIFIVGTERSGSNLLRLILDAHEGIAIPHPPHIMKDLGPRERSYGDLRDDACFARLARDAARLVDLHFAPWPFRIDGDAIVRDAGGRGGERDLYAIYAALQEQYRRHAGKRRWGCKSTFMIHYVERILKSHAEPRFVHIVRDARDVAVSARDSVFNYYHPHYVARLWSEQQRLALEWRARLPARLFRTIRYEDLLARPEETVRTVFDFVGERYAPESLEFFKRDSARSLAGLSASWANLSRPILTSNRGKYRKSLTPREVREIERIAGHELAEFGYILDHDPQELAAPGPVSRLGFYAADRARAAQVELRALVRDRNAWRRLRKRAYLWRIGNLAGRS